VNRRTTAHVILLVLAWLTAGLPAQACNIPVFRYALENWIPDPYPVFVLHRGPLSAEQQQLADQLKATCVDPERPANLQAFAVDVDELAADSSDSPDSSDSSGREEWPPILKEFLSAAIADRDMSSPQLVALFPAMIGRPFVAWQAEFNEANVGLLVDSPIRQEVAKRLLTGQSAVWVFIDSGHEEADEEAFQRLQTELQRLQSEVELPDQQLIESDEFFRPEVEIELKVEFSVIRVRRDDPQEVAWVSMLLGSEPDLRDFDEPITIPIYGRGRTYFALVGKGINPEMIEENCWFLCGACSCQVKQENPGVDMLIAHDWAGQVVGTAMPDLVLPELTGIGALEVAEATPAETVQAEEETVSEESSLPDDSSGGEMPGDAEATTVAAAQSLPTETLPTETPPSSRFESTLLMWLLGIVATGFVLALVATLLLRRNASIP
jgi:hypothetical protein